MAALRGHLSRAPPTPLPHFLPDSPLVRRFRQSLGAFQRGGPLPMPPPSPIRPGQRRGPSVPRPIDLPLFSFPPPCVPLRRSRRERTAATRIATPQSPCMHGSRTGDRLDLAAHLHDVLLRLDHIRASHEEKGRGRGKLHVELRHLCSCEEKTGMRVSDTDRTRTRSEPRARAATRTSPFAMVVAAARAGGERASVGKGVGTENLAKISDVEENADTTSRRSKRCAPSSSHPRRWVRSCPARAPRRAGNPSFAPPPNSQAASMATARDVQRRDETLCCTQHEIRSRGRRSGGDRAAIRRVRPQPQPSCPPPCNLSRFRTHRGDERTDGNDTSRGLPFAVSHRERVTHPRGVDARFPSPFGVLFHDSSALHSRPFLSSVLGSRIP